jgi:hypothetical protein
MPVKGSENRFAGVSEPGVPGSVSLYNPGKEVS